MIVNIKGSARGDLELDVHHVLAVKLLPDMKMKGESIMTGEGYTAQQVVMIGHALEHIAKQFKASRTYRDCLLECAVNGVMPAIDEAKTEDRHTDMTIQVDREDDEPEDEN